MNRKPTPLITLLLGLWLVVDALPPRQAFAYPYYIESQTGAAQFRSTNELFGSGSAAATDMGMAFNLGIFYAPFEPNIGFDFNIGAELTYFSGNDTSANYSALMPLGMARIQFLWGYISGGIAPYLLLRNKPEAGYDNFNPASNTGAYVVEFGLLYPATPKFSIGGSALLTWFTLTTGPVASPSTQYNLVMRFYFGHRTQMIGENGAPVEFDGWRYIGK